MGDKTRLSEALAGYREEFGQRRWYVNERHWFRVGASFIHAKRRSRSGRLTEAMVIVRSSGQNVRMRRYLLLPEEEEWLACDQDAFDGFLKEGHLGLTRGRVKVKRTYCNCKFKVHRSGSRASAFARELARMYGKTGVQRSYRCSENPRAFHLTAQEKGSGRLIPDAYIDADDGEEGYW